MSVFLSARGTHLGEDLILITELGYTEHMEEIFKAKRQPMLFPRGTLAAAPPMASSMLLTLGHRKPGCHAAHPTTSLLLSAHCAQGHVTNKADLSICARWLLCILPDLGSCGNRRRVREQCCCRLPCQVCVFIRPWLGLHSSSVSGVGRKPLTSGSIRPLRVTTW